ncbi:MAG: SdrD B-like domain-containing protein [Isosphaeraceae bacterium]
MSLFPRLAKRAAADRPSYQTRKLAPVVETFESRQLLSTCPASPVTGLGTIAGTAFVDLNKDGHLNGSDTYLKGVTVQLYKADGSNCPIATTQTNSLGAYSFTGVKPGDYLVKEIAPCGFKSTGTEVNSDLNPASGVSSDTIKVTVVDPSKVFLNYNGVDGDRYVLRRDPVRPEAAERLRPR